MSSDSDTDDDTQNKKFMEAADTHFLNNSMFERHKLITLVERATSDDKTNMVVTKEKDLPKSQRYIEDHESSGADFKISESMQNHVAKKLAEILKKHYEFDYVTNIKHSEKNKTKNKSRVKLLRGDDCYVNPYEDYEYATKGPDKKPIIKRRSVGNLDDDITNEEQLKLIVVNGNDILSGSETKLWFKKKDRKDKVFHYKMASNGVLYAKEELNEFTDLRRKNNWNESKIKAFKRFKHNDF